MVRGECFCKFKNDTIIMIPLHNRNETSITHFLPGVVYEPFIDT